MQKIKKTLKLVGILTLVSVIFNIISICLDLFYYKYDFLYLLIDILALFVTIGTGVTYLFMLKKGDKFILTHINWFTIISLLNIVNIFINWIFAFWVQIVVIQNAKRAALELQNNSNAKTSSKNINNEIILGQDDYFVRDQMDNLTEELNEIERKKQSNEISQEEYDNLKQECIDKYMKTKS